MKNKKEIPEKTFEYRGISTDIYSDDYGQQFYFYYKGKCYGCGTYNLYPEQEIMYIIDHDLDYICDLSQFDERFFGAHCKYANHEHTKVEFSFRGEVIKIYNIDDYQTIDNICKDCLARLNRLFNDPEFIKMEEERKAKGNLYFSELVKQAEEEKDD